MEKNQRLVSCIDKILGYVLNATPHVFSGKPQNLISEARSRLWHDSPGQRSLSSKSTRDCLICPLKIGQWSISWSLEFAEFDKQLSYSMAEDRGYICAGASRTRISISMTDT